MTEIDRNMLQSIIKDRGLKMSDLSKSIGKNHSYISQYINKNTPKDLPYSVMRALMRELSLNIVDNSDDLDKPRLSNEEKDLIKKFKRLNDKQKKLIHSLIGELIN